MKVFYVDDEKKILNAFAGKHAKDGISVETCNDVRKVVETLEARNKHNLPDILIMDLYSTKDEFDSPKALETNQKVDELVDKISKVREELSVVVTQNKTPAAIDTLRNDN